LPDAVTVGGTYEENRASLVGLLPTATNYMTLQTHKVMWFVAVGYRLAASVAEAICLEGRGHSMCTALPRTDSCCVIVLTDSYMVEQKGRTLSW